MSKTSWLTGPSVNRHPDVDYVLYITEQIVQVAVRHVKSHVPNEKGLGRTMQSSGHEAGSRGSLPTTQRELHIETAAFEGLHVKHFNG